MKVLSSSLWCITQETLLFTWYYVHSSLDVAFQFDIFVVQYQVILFTSPCRTPSVQDPASYQ